MKLKHLAVVTALTSFSFISCNNDDKSTTVTTADTTQTQMADVNVVADQAAIEGTSVAVTDADLPQEARTSFSTTFPKAERITWMRYKPGPNDDFEMDQNYYYVRFNADGADYTAWYNNQGQWVKTSTVVKGPKELPDAVNKYINANYSDYTIEEISKENDKDMDMYEIKLNKGEQKVKLKILPNGEVFKKK